jgi:hypothetical protein
VQLILLLVLLTGAAWSEVAFGTWRMNAARSTLGGDIRPKSVTVRIEPHAGGEALTLDRVEADGRATSYSTILYLDGEPRQFQDFACSGIQSSRRVDGWTVEVLRMCASGAWLRWVRRSVVQSKELVLDVTEQSTDGRRIERRLVLEKR